MSEALAYGVDFGTSNSLISIAYPDRVAVVDVGSRRVPENLPSIIYLAADGNRAAGDPALEQYLVTGGRESRLLVGLKSDLSDRFLSQTSSWDRTYSVPDLVAIVLSALKQRADRLCGTKVDRVVLGYPVAFAGTEGPEFEMRQELAVTRLQEGAELAGFRDMQLLPEPAAAVQDEVTPDGVVVALDFGGGTFDVAVVEFSDEQGEVLALQGASIGGERFDQLLFDALVGPALGLHSEYRDEYGQLQRLPSRLRAKSRSVLGLRDLIGDVTMPQIIERFRKYEGGEKLAAIQELLYGGLGFAFYESIEQAKIDLSTRSSTSIEFHASRLNLSIPVSRETFDSLIADDVQVLRRTILRALEQCDVAPNKVQAVLRTGGSASIPAFLSMVEEVFGTGKLQAREPFTTVVRGLGCYAQTIWD
jgi:hypothetical chaperone protein